MSISFARETNEELVKIIKVRKEEIQKYHSIKKKLERMKAESDVLLMDVHFTIRPSFEDIFQSLNAFIGVYTSEILDAEAELEKRKKPKT